MPSPTRILKYAGVAIVAILALGVLGFLTGVLGVPTVEGIENKFADVNETATTIETNLTVSNPNPIGISLGGLSVDYGIRMNNVSMATGQKEGVSIGSGNSTIPFRTYLVNENIPEWWYTHVSNGEQTDILIDVDLSHGLLGGQAVSVPQEQSIQTDILGQFNDSTTRPVNANAAVISDPVLYINETAAWYGDNITREQTPMEMAFTVYNPKQYPYTVTEVGYEVRMNGILVGEGSSARSYTVPGETERTIQASTILHNQRLDEWWVSHLERDQVTNLTVDMYLIIDPDTSDVLQDSIPAFRIDTDEFDYQTVIETDIFGTKATDGLSADEPPASDGADDSDDEPTSTPTDTADQTETATTTETSTATPTPTPTPTATETDDGGILG